jgi:7-cyano-7-deazaguanine synthase in queuosine biosynthesis
MTTNRVYIGVNSSNNDIHLYPGKNLYTGEKYLEEEFGSINSLEKDLLNLASGIYASDLAILRQEREHYIRNIELTVEVVNFHAFQLIKDNLERALYVVSRDNWTLNFIQSSTSAAVTNFIWNRNEGAVLLFSGGIDSMSAAAEFVKTGSDLVLVSHNSQGNRVIDDCQKNVHALLEKHFNKTIKHIHVKVYGRKQLPYDFPEDRENTQRTRSFLFLSLAALITRRSGFNKVLYMAENGQFSIHLPLNQARVGPFSTHTADPEFVEITKEIFRTLLSNQDFNIINPFLYFTKAEVFAKMPLSLQKEAHYSASCWMISRTPGNKHCGYCIPCISRRIAIEFSGIHFDEYANDIFKMNLDTLSDTDDKKRNLVDYLEFISKFKSVTPINKGNLMADFPEFFNPAIDLEAAIKLYERVSSQSYMVFKNYPAVLKLIG